MSKKRVLLIFGGVSTEHEVSRKSASSVFTNLDKEKYDVIPVGITKSGEWILYGGDSAEDIKSGAWENCPGNRPAILSPSRPARLLVLDGGTYTMEEIDIALPILHGKNGEDGTIQGLFELSGLPFGGCGCGASANCMDKVAAHLILRGHVDQAKQVHFSKYDFMRDPDGIIREIVEKINSFPIYIKPSSSGSSVGITMVKSEDALYDAITLALEHDDKILAEEGIPGRELQVSVLGNDDLIVSSPGEVVSGQEFFSYDAKYNDKRSQFLVPADVPADIAEKCRELAKDIYRRLSCRGFARVDFFYWAEKGRIIFNEINTIPGFTSISLYPRMMGDAGVPYGELMDRIIELGLDRE